MIWFNRPWYDAFLLTYVAVVFFLLAVRIRRESSLGWSLTTLCVILGCVFANAVFFSMPRQPLAQHLTPATFGLRAVLACVLTWVVWEVEFSRIELAAVFRREPPDARSMVGRRERVVGRREGVATQREDVATRREDCLDNLIE